jgi:hypothetical protein
MLVGDVIETPTHADLVANTNTESLIRYLTGVVGIEENEYVPPHSATRPPLEASIQHALFFNFQRQYEIANREALFHRQTEEFISQAIRDVLPYFLGAVNSDQVVRRSELRRAQRQLRLLEQRIERSNVSRSTSVQEASVLVAEATEVGLLSGVQPEGSADELMETLQAALDSSIDLAAASINGGNRFMELQADRLRLRGEYASVRDQIDLLRAVLIEHDEYSNAANEHVARLEAVNLLPDGAASAPHRCPVCDQDVEELAPSVQQLTESLQAVSQQLQSVSRDEPRVRRLLAELEERASSLQGEMGLNQAALDALAAQEDEVTRLREQLNVQSYVRGRIKYFLEHLAQLGPPDLTGLDSEVTALMERVRQLESELSLENVQDNVISILNAVGQDMRVWAERLGLEHSEFPVRIDATRLTVVADSDTGTIPMTQMGSGQNWVGYHLVAYLALHKLFVEQNRPVPRFLVLDQPTQAFYPPDTPPDEAALGDSDREAVEAIFLLLHEVASELAPELQVIVMDHASLDKQWFQDAIVEEWRGGERLIPASWYA